MWGQVEETGDPPLKIPGRIGFSVPFGRMICGVKGNASMSRGQWTDLTPWITEQEVNAWWNMVATADDRVGREDLEPRLGIADHF